MATTDLTRRARAVLYAVVTEFIATGEPVGSRTLSKKPELLLSPATIRNVLADLEDAGFLQQPHTSAGRVPTEAAFRLYINALMHVRALKPDESQKIAQRFEEMAPEADMLRETGRLLAELSGAAAVLVRSRTDGRIVVKMRFIPTRPSELLSVIVFSDGSVENRFVTFDTALTEQELERVHNMLEEACEGRTLADVREYLSEALSNTRDTLLSFRQLGYSLANLALEGASTSVEVVIEGQARLFEQPEFRDGDRVRELLHVLDDREKLITLLDRTLEASEVRVFLGQETADAVGCPVSLVAAPYLAQGGHPGGAVGVLGPTRMDYPSVVPLVGATAAAMSRRLGKNRDNS
ncbi:MAG: heat-inducible transcriptional repressor HrcA [Polyangiaceae bacterium]|nr:heat-inducible transcriptional repressor HrcA [Polyangiaceae bacterium]